MTSTTVGVGQARKSHDSHVPDDGRDFDNTEDKLRLAIALDAKEVDHYDQYQKDSHPCGIQRDVLDLLISINQISRAARQNPYPVIDGDRGAHNLQRENDEPLKRIIPAHGEPPRRVLSRVSNA
jgi:hypothetical protein